MKNLLLILSILLPQDSPKELPKPAPRIATGSWASMLKSHPRLFGSREYLRTLAKSKAGGYGEIKTLSSIQALGIVHAVDGLTKEKVDSFLANVLKNVSAGPTNEHQDTWLKLNEAAFVYDLFYDLISARDRQAIVGWMNAHLPVFTGDETAFHNSTLSKIMTYLNVAYATWGDNPKAKEFRDYALVKLYEGKVLPILLEFGDGGGFTECGWYTRGSLWNLVQGLELARRFEKYDGFQKAARFFYQRLAYEMFQPYPGLWKEGYDSERFPCEGDGSFVYGGHVEYPRLTRTVLAQHFRGSELSKAVANRKRKGTNPDVRLSDFFWEEDPDPALDLSSFPLAHLASGIGRLYARSDWSDDATWFRFECGPYLAHHQHLEAGNFEIFRREPLATESGEYVDYSSNHDVNWLIRSIAHNCVLVYQPDETWQNLRDGGKNKYANDGGQTTRGEWFPDNIEDYKKKRDIYDHGKIVAYENRPEFLYVAGDATKAYSSSKLSLWTRQVVFVRPSTFIILDRVVATRGEYEKAWVLHSRHEPEIRGETVTVADGKGKLTFRTLLPEQATIRKVEGYTYRGQTFEATKGVLSDTAPRWRVEVLPPAPHPEDLFLHVLTTDEPAPAKLIKKDGKFGVHVGSVEVLFDSSLGATLIVSGKTFPLKPDVKKGKFE